MLYFYKKENVVDYISKMLIDFRQTANQNTIKLLHLAH